jgi:hypothetical protein
LDDTKSSPKRVTRSLTQGEREGEERCQSVIPLNSHKSFEPALNKKITWSCWFPNLQLNPLVPLSLVPLSPRVRLRVTHLGLTSRHPSWTRLRVVQRYQRKRRCQSLSAVGKFFFSLFFFSFFKTLFNRKRCRRHGHHGRGLLPTLATRRRLPTMATRTMTTTTHHGKKLRWATDRAGKGGRGRRWQQGLVLVVSSPR